MNIRKTIITATVALTMVAMIAPSIAGASTISDLQAQINALMAQLNSLQGSTTTSSSIPAVCVGITFSRNLTVGSVGSDVRCLQAILNVSGYPVASSGAGSPGNETTTFGPRTLVAVKSWQAAQGWTPAAQIGPMSRAKLNAWLMGGTVVTNPNNPPPPVQTGPVNAMLASDNPASGVIIGSQASADMLHINFTGSGTVTSVTLKRAGVSDQNLFTNVYLYDGNTRITDGYSFNASSMFTINGLNINVNGSHTISVRGDVEAGASATEGSAVISLTSFTANGSTVNSNVTGNLMAVVSGSLAAISLGTNAQTGTPSVNAGTMQYPFWTATLSVTTRAVMLKAANFKMIGSAPSDALGNIKLFIDGVDTGKTATVMAINGSSYAVLDLTSNPISLATGSHQVELRADIQKGTSRTLQLSLQQASDLTIFDSQVGVNVAVSGTIPNSGSNVQIATGSVTVVLDPAFTAMTTISGGATNAVIAKFKVHAYGEDIKISSLQVNPYITLGVASGCTATDGTTGAASSGQVCGLSNVTLFFNGSQVGTQKNFTQVVTTAENSTTAANDLAVFQLGSQLIAPAGVDSWLEVHADVQTTNNAAYTSGTIKVALPFLTSGANYNNGTGQMSQSSVSAPSSAVVTTGLAIGTGGLVVSKNTNYLNQNITPNTANVKIGSFTIQNQSTSQSVRLTSLKVLTGINSSATPGTTATDITDLSALRTSDTTGSGSTPIQPTGSDTFSVNDTLAPGTSMTLDIFANTSTNAVDYIMTSLQVTSIGVTDNILAYFPSSSTYTSGQILSLGNGTLGTPTLVVASTTPAQFIASAVPAGASNASQAAFKFISTGGAANITELKFTVSGSDASPTQTVTSVCVGSTCQVVSGATTATAYLTGLNLVVPNGGGGLTQNVTVSYSGVGTGGIVPGMGSTLSLAYIKYTAGGTTTTLTGTSLSGSDFTSVAAPMVTLVGSKPTVVVAAGGSSGYLKNSSVKVGQVTVTADAKGAIKVRKITFNIGYSGFTAAPTSTSAEFIALGGTSTAITGSSCAATSSGTVETCTLGTSYASDFDIAAGQSQQFDLYLTNDTGTFSTSVASVSSTATAAGFVWDDTSINGVNGAGVGLTGTLIYGFPTNSYSIHQ